MIVNVFFDTLFSFIKFLLNPLPTIPNLPDSILNSINEFLDLIFNNVGILNFFIPVTTLKICIPILILIMSFDYLYKLIMFVVKKIPFVNIK